MPLPQPLDDHLRRHVVAALGLYLKYCREQYIEPHPTLVALCRWTSQDDQARQETTTLPAGASGVHGAPMRLLLTYDEAAQALGVSRRTVERRVDAGELPVVRVSGSPRILREDLESFLTANRTDMKAA